MTIIFYALRLIFKTAELLLLLRAICSWLPALGGVYELLFSVTESIILPARRLFEKMNWENSLPIDLPFLVTFIAISILDSVLFSF